LEPYNEFLEYLQNLIQKNNFLNHHIRAQEGTCFATNPSGGMSIVKGKLNSLWHSYCVSVYEKNELTKASTGNVEYNYIGERDVERCTALTQKTHNV
jgi:hypothetical protein